MNMRPQPFVSLAVFVWLALIPSHAQEFASRAERELFSACNRERQAQGLPTLKWNTSLAEAARRHAQLMVTNQTISHQFPGEPSLSTRASRAGVSWMGLAENVAEAPSPQEIHSLWMHSPGHRANILDRNLDSIGVAVIERGAEYYAVEDFSKAKVAPLERNQ